MLAVPLGATALVSQSADTTVSGNSLRKSHTPLQRAVGEPVSHLRSCNSSFEDSSPLIPHHVIMCLIDRFLIHSIVGDFFFFWSCHSRRQRFTVAECYVWRKINVGDLSARLRVDTHNSSRAADTSQVGAGGDLFNFKAQKWRQERFSLSKSREKYSPQ